MELTSSMHLDSRVEYIFGAQKCADLTLTGTLQGRTNL